MSLRHFLGVPCFAALGAGCGAVGSPEVLIRVEEVAPGEDCSAGGLLIAVGQDEDGDGELGDSEIASAEYVCNGAPGNPGQDGEGARPLPSRVEGSYTISNSIELELFRDVEEITGDLVVTGGGLSELLLPSLQVVGGDLRVTQCETLGTASFPALLSVGGDLQVGQNPELLLIDLGHVASVGESLTINANERLSSLPIPTELSSIGRDLYLVGNGQVDAIRLPDGLAAIGNDARIGWNPLLVELDFGGVAEVGNNLQVAANPLLATVAATELVWVSNNYSVFDNTVLCQSIVDAILDAVTVGGTTTTTGNNSGC